jgi:hypothetical protein
MECEAECTSVEDGVQMLLFYVVKISNFVLNVFVGMKNFMFDN